MARKYSRLGKTIQSPKKTAGEREMRKDSMTKPPAPGRSTLANLEGPLAEGQCHKGKAGDERDPETMCPLRRAQRTKHGCSAHRWDKSRLAGRTEHDRHPQMCSRQVGCLSADCMYQHARKREH